MRLFKIMKRPKKTPVFRTSERCIGILEWLHQYLNNLALNDSNISITKVCNIISLCVNKDKNWKF